MPRPLPRAAALVLLLSAAPAAGGQPAPARPAGPDLPAAARPKAPGPEVAALVRRCVEASGGAAAVSQAALLRQEGTVTSLLHPGEPGRIARFYARPGRLRVEVAYGGGPAEVRVLDGGRGWRHGGEASGPVLVSMILQAARLDLPAMLAAWPERIVDRGAVRLDGRVLRVLALEVAPGVEVEASIDPETGRILRSGGRSVDGPPIQFVTLYSDFRTVGPHGLVVAFREENWANGAVTGETVLTRVTVEDALPEATFRP